MTQQTARIAADTIFTDRHTAYGFTAEQVSDEQLHQVYELAKFTPTALNSQPLRVTFVRSPEAKARLLPLIAERNRAKSASAPVVAILAADTDFHEHLPVVNPQLEGARERFARNPENRAGMALNNAWLQAGGFILAVRAVGLDAGPMGGINAAGSTPSSSPVPRCARSWWSTSVTFPTTAPSRATRGWASLRQ